MTSHWQLQPIFGSYLLVFALVAAMLLLLPIGPSFANLSIARRRWLTILRGLLVLLMLLAMLRPARVSTKRHVQTAQLLVLFDASLSMTVSDAEGGRARWQVQHEMLQRALPQLANMGENFQVELLAFADGLQPQPHTDGTFRLQAKPIGEATDIGGAIHDAIQRHPGKRLAAVVLISDGAQRAPSSNVPPQQAARQLDRRATPLYTIAIGQSRDQSQSRDVAIENLQDQYSVFVKNEFVLRVGVRIQGYVNQSVPVKLEVEDEAGNVESIGPYDLRATRDSQVVMVEFSYRPQKAGQYQLRVSAEVQPGETGNNNQLTAFLNVREGGLRVLLLTSALLHEEQKFLRRSLDESVDIELDFQPIDVLTQPQWPLDLQADVPLEEYDVFLIGDLDASAIRNDNWQRIADLVAEGRGLMMYGGAYSFGPGGYGDTPLAEVLPVAMNRFERQPIDPRVAIRSDVHIAGPLTMLPTSDHAITHIARDEGNLAAWKSLQPLWGANRLGRLQDRAVVLAETQDGDPLLVQGSYVLGRVLALATDSTHRWWRHGQQAAHKKFWRQAILWLARRDQQQVTDVWISLPQRRFLSGSRIVFQTGLNDEDGDPITDTDFAATLTLPSGEVTEAIDLSTDDDGMRGVITNAREPGIYRLRVRALDDSTEIGSQYVHFVVLRRNLELNDPAANPGLLDSLARMTERLGGKAIAPEQFPKLLETIKASPPSDEIETQSKWQLGDTAADAWSFFLLLVGLLGSEWYLRKRWGLV